MIFSRGRAWINFSWGWADLAAIIYNYNYSIQKGRRVMIVVDRIELNKSLSPIRGV